MSFFYSDFDNKQKQREKMRQEVQDLLVSEETTLEDVFGLQSQEKQDEIMNQFTGANKNVMKFFQKRQRLQELIDFLTVLPDPENDSKDRCHKYPFLAHQLFTDGGDGVSQIVEQFFYSHDQPKSSKKPEPTITRSIGSDKNVTKVKVVVKAPGLSPMQPLGSPQKASAIVLSPPLGHENDQPEDSPEQNQEIFKNIENVVNLLNEAEIKAKKRKEEQKREENAFDDFERDDDEDLEFGFEDAIDQPLDQISDPAAATETSPNQQFNFDEIIQKIENPNNVRKSFELRYQNDDDDDIFIVHDGEEDGDAQPEQEQDNLFVQPPTLDFNIIEDNQKNDANSNSPLDGFEKIDFSPREFHDAQDGNEVDSPPAISGQFNPFIDTLANSEALPATKKIIPVKIEENYIDPAAKPDDESTFTQKMAQAEQKGPLEPLSQSVRVTPSEKLDDQSEQQKTSTLHQQNLIKRKQKKGGKSLSIHQFDEATQKSIEDAVRQNLNETEEQQLDKKPDTEIVDMNKKKSEKYAQNQKKMTKNQQETGQTLTFSIVDDHIKDNSPKKDDSEPAQIENEQSPDPLGDELNDREDTEIQITNTDKKDEMESTPPLLDDGEEDNILRKQAVKLNLQNEKQEQIADATPETNSPTSPLSPLDGLNSPKFKDQESIELEEKPERQQDYTLINHFFSFLDNRNGKEPLNSTLSGYFCKVTLIIISHQPKELLNYMQSNNFELIDKMLQYIDDKSICELITKIMDEILKQVINNSQDGNATITQENLANSFANLNESENKLLQQSGQSSEKIDRDQKIEEMLNKCKNVLYKILEEKMGEESDPLEQLGALEILLDLLKNKLCYQILTTKHSFKIITQILVSDSADSKKNIYILLKSIMSNYEKHERFEKRINIDNLDDEELMNSHSGSGLGILNRSKKSKGSRRQNQDVLKDVQESDLFQFIRVVVQEITSPEIETRYDQIQEAKQNQTRLPLGMFFVSVIEFIEKASQVFSGFLNDMNRTLVDKDIFNYMFDILEYYQNSDIMNRTISNILTNIMRSKSDDVPDMMKYLLEDTKLVNFLVTNGPKCIQTEIKQINNSSSLNSSAKMLQNYQSGSGADHSGQAQSPRKTTADHLQDQAENTGQKSPEQSSQIIDDGKPTESGNETNKKFKVQVPCKNSTPLQAHVKLVSEVLLELSQINSDKQSLAKSNDPTASKPGQNQSQSGEQSKSSEIIIEDDDLTIQQNISKIVSINLNENSEWQSFINNQIQPISRLLKGKLCDDQNNSTSGFINSDNQIFDDDFMRSSLDDDKVVTSEALQKLSNDFDNAINSLDASKSSSDAQGNDSDKDEVDHQKFFKKMQQCLNSNLKRPNPEFMIDTHEREMKQKAFHSMAESLSENLRASLTDQNQLSDLDDINRDPNSLSLGGRQRSLSKEFSLPLPPLQDFDDHKDQANQNDQEVSNLLQHYKSNEKGQKMTSVDPDLSAIAQIDDNDYSAQPEKRDLQLDEVEINLDDSDELDRQGTNKLNEVDTDLNTFDDFANSLNEAIDSHQNMAVPKKQNLTLDIQNSNHHRELGDIFEKIEEFDSIFGTISPTNRSPDMFKDGNNIGQDFMAAGNQPSPQAIPMNRNSFGVNKSEIIVQMNKMDEQNLNQNMDNEQDPFASSPQSDMLPEDNEVFGQRIDALSPQENKDNDLNEDINERDFEPEAEDNKPSSPSSTDPKPHRKSIQRDTNDLQSSKPNLEENSSSRNLSKSVYVSNKTIDLLDETNQEFLDNQFWKINPKENYNVEDLFQDMMDNDTKHQSNKE